MDFAAPDNFADEPLTRILGRRGEELAAKYLERAGFRLVAANFIVPVGRNRRNAVVTAEIDLIAYERETLVFIEVKTRSSSDYASPETAVNLRKQRQITRAARRYRQIFQLAQTAFRYDVIGIVLPANQKPSIELMRNFWNESKFRKKSWADQTFFD